METLNQPQGANPSNSKPSIQFKVNGKINKKQTIKSVLKEAHSKCTKREYKIVSHTKFSDSTQDILTFTDEEKLQKRLTFNSKKARYYNECFQTKSCSITLNSAYDSIVADIDLYHDKKEAYIEAINWFDEYFFRHIKQKAGRARLINTLTGMLKSKFKNDFQYKTQSEINIESQSEDRDVVETALTERHKEFHFWSNLLDESQTSPLLHSEMYRLEEELRISFDRLSLTHLNMLLELLCDEYNLHIEQSITNKIVALSEAGLSNRQIAEKMKMCRKKIGKILKS